MIDTGKRYYIVDTSSHYYMLTENNSLVAARDSSEATLFTIQDANARISTGRKARYYSVVEANVEHVRPEEPTTKTEDVYRAPELDAFETPTMFDNLHNDWESVRASPALYLESR